MPNSTTDAQRFKLNKDPITDVHIILLEFQEDRTATKHRAAINNEDYYFEGEQFVATDISFSLPNSGDQESRVSLEMSDLTRVMGPAINYATNRIGCRIRLVDTSLSPDEAIIDTRNLFVLSNASSDGVRMSAELGMRVSFQEPIPFKRTSKTFFPGVWFSK